MLRLIVNADDFGLSPTVNEAVSRALRGGVLTSASLMVTGAAAAEAVAIARAHRRLAVGLHLAVADAAPALPPERIPHLVGPDGLLERDPARAGLRYAASAPARRELALEIAAQFALFAATGLPLSHVDGHHHLHVHPAVLPVVARLARHHGASGVRLPCETLGSLRSGSLGDAASAAVLRLVAGRWRGVLRRHGLSWASEVHGIVHSGRMDERHALDTIRRLSASTAEIFFHPSTERGLPDGANPGDLAALLSPAVAEAVSRRGAQLSTYADLGAA